MARVLDRVARDALSIGVATGVYAVSFGVLSVAAGFSVAQTCVMSVVAFTGASQFTFVSVMGAGGGVAAALPPAVLLAARNGIYALSLGSVLRAGRWRRALDAHLVIDESTAMAHAQRDPAERRRGFVLTAAAIFACWNAGTLAGALAGGSLGDPRSLGLDAIFPAVFLALLVPQVRTRGALGAAIAGAAIAVVLLPVAPIGRAGHGVRAGRAPVARPPVAAMSWAAVFALCGAAYGLKVLGSMAASRAAAAPAADGRLDILVVPVLAGLIAVGTLGQGRDLVLDARLPALLVAGALVWRGAPLLVVVLGAGATAAVLHGA